MAAGFWEGLAYAIARGICTAYFEVRARYESASREVLPDEGAQARGRRIADAVHRLPEGDRPPG